MSNSLTRRWFLSVAVAFLATQRGWSRTENIQTGHAQNKGGAREAVPKDLDHILLGVSDLDQGIAWMEARCGVRAAYGGVHPGRGTRNALLALGSDGNDAKEKRQRRYLEIIAPDPAQTKSEQEGTPQQSRPSSGAPNLADELRKLKEPRLIGWAVHTDDVAAVAEKARAAGLTFIGPRDGSRARPDGRMLRWKTLTLQRDYDGLLPFFIEWSPDSVHPSRDAPQGCRLERFMLQSPQFAQSLALSDACRKLGLDVTVAPGKANGLRARISSPKGEFELA
jgi:catechol 2,3-dioxygenase-like lactoylglutathione lyase family enzyme